MGHLISMVELGKLITKHHPSYSIIVLTLIPSFNTGTIAAYVRHVSATSPTITFHHLPDIPLDPLSFPTIEAIVFELIRCSNPNVDRALQTISSSSNITAFVIDMFCTSAISVADNLNLPVYYFFTSGACFLAQLLYMPTLDKTTTKSLKDMNTLIHSPGLPLIPSSDIVVPLLDRTSTDYSDFLEICKQLPKSIGIIINTFDSLEPKAIKAINDGVCVPDRPTPPIYCVGPLVASGGDGSHECLSWLDLQPSGSVVYLCFGSGGAFSSEQLKEIAKGLEMSGFRFLWVVRSPPSTKKEDRFLPPPEPDLDVLLPEGFLERTKDRGFVVKKWAPQVDVLRHKSVGGFVTHCGWNSILEAVCAGVPMVAWPLYAEQKFNKVVLRDDMKLALAMDESEGGMVTAIEVEKRVRQLMEGDEGKVVREVVTTRKKEAEMALSDGGSSRAALSKLLGKFIIKHHPSYSITVLTLTNSFNTGSITSYVQHISATIPAIAFHHLPDIPLDLKTYPSTDAVLFDLIQRSVHNVADALKSISPSALIIDLFCTSAMAAAAKLNIPVYYFITSGACCVVELLYFPTLDRDYPGSFKDMNRLVYSPGMPPILSSDMPAPVLDRSSTDYAGFLELSRHMPKAAGIIVNTFDSLEPNPIKAIRDGLCVPDQPTPPLYCVGPLLADGSDGSHECLKWLDGQPRHSVVYLCFGSEGLFSIDQLKEIAKGLEMSGHRFLWVIRSPPTVNKDDLDLLLPDGFLGRVKDRGLVVKNWAPQVKVLGHESVGGFVTHCGWNSVLEATRAGVPMVAWPLYAEQRLNRIMMVEEMKLALPMEELEDGKVAAAEVDKRVRQLMDSAEGKLIREVVKARKVDAMRALGEGGSSRVALATLVKSWQPSRPHSSS
ncbi:hypothetical protein M8C21_023949 [Ambrosia artemisiifolia]|uniref:UDP-glycosyltransferases domain-containing protein n=1 Tax=Ambrosia artemisiifolia TaxID=4212 RepID=A0AAD5D5S8_AMBAR|nr:hypothetical protein M8C21_023949 [Ambrosia artemisiifolia]